MAQPQAKAAARGLTSSFQLRLMGCRVHPPDISVANALAADPNPVGSEHAAEPRGLKFPRYQHPGASAPSRPAPCSVSPHA